eukprot:GILJ01000957.1.p1 GENE.GILJ01000957.1~~GILJ01000957.1.p1  ORF type:complete len:1643 (-),score=302.61 GILJ01000957.1:219-5147(-)
MALRCRFVAVVVSILAFASMSAAEVHETKCELISVGSFVTPFNREGECAAAVRKFPAQTVLEKNMQAQNKEMCSIHGVPGGFTCRNCASTDSITAVIPATGFYICKVECTSTGITRTLKSCGNKEHMVSYVKTQIQESLRTIEAEQERLRGLLANEHVSDVDSAVVGSAKATMQQLEKIPVPERTVLTPSSAEPHDILSSVMARMQSQRPTPTVPQRVPSSELGRRTSIDEEEEDQEAEADDESEATQGRDTGSKRRSRRRGKAKTKGLPRQRTDSGPSKAARGKGSGAPTILAQRSRSMHSSRTPPSDDEEEGEDELLLGKAHPFTDEDEEEDVSARRDLLVTDDEEEALEEEEPALGLAPSSVPLTARGSTRSEATRRSALLAQEAAKLSASRGSRRADSVLSDLPPPSTRKLEHPTLTRSRGPLRQRSRSKVVGTFDASRRSVVAPEPQSTAVSGKQRKRAPVLDGPPRRAADEFDELAVRDTVATRSTRQPKRVAFQEPTELAASDTPLPRSGKPKKHVTFHVPEDEEDEEEEESVGGSTPLRALTVDRTTGKRSGLPPQPSASSGAEDAAECIEQFQRFAAGNEISLMTEAWSGCVARLPATFADTWKPKVEAYTLLAEAIKSPTSRVMEVRSTVQLLGECCAADDIVKQGMRYMQMDTEWSEIVASCSPVLIRSKQSEYSAVLGPDNLKGSEDIVTHFSQYEESFRTSTYTGLLEEQKKILSSPVKKRSLPDSVRPCIESLVATFDKMVTAYVQLLRVQNNAASTVEDCKTALQEAQDVSLPADLLQPMHEKLKVLLKDCVPNVCLAEAQAVAANPTFQRVMRLRHQDHLLSLQPKVEACAAAALEAFGKPENFYEEECSFNSGDLIRHMVAVGESLVDKDDFPFLDDVPSSEEVMSTWDKVEAYLPRYRTGQTHTPWDGDLMIVCRQKTANPCQCFYGGIVSQKTAHKNRGCDAETVIPTAIHDRKFKKFPHLFSTPDHIPEQRISIRGNPFLPQEKLVCEGCAATGSSGAVFAASCETPDGTSCDGSENPEKQYALKRLYKTPTGEQQVNRLLRKLCHDCNEDGSDHVVQSFGDVFYKNHQFLMYEWLGEPKWSKLVNFIETNAAEEVVCKDVLAQSPDNRFTTVNNILKQLLEALDFMNSNRVVHRNLKVSNVYLGILNEDEICVRETAGPLGIKGYTAKIGSLSKSLIDSKTEAALDADSSLILPPEAQASARTYARFPLWSTDIYGLATIYISLVTGKQLTASDLPAMALKNADEEAKRFAEKEFSLSWQALNKFRSDATNNMLLDFFVPYMIVRMTRFDPIHRINPREALEVLEFVGQYEPDIARLLARGLERKVQAFVNLFKDESLPCETLCSAKQRNNLCQVTTDDYMKTNAPGEALTALFFQDHRKDVKGADDPRQFESVYEPKVMEKKELEAIKFNAVNHERVIHDSCMAVTEAICKTEAPQCVDSCKPLQCRVAAERLVDQRKEVLWEKGMPKSTKAHPLGPLAKYQAVLLNSFTECCNKGQTKLDFGAGIKRNEHRKNVAKMILHRQTDDLDPGSFFKKLLKGVPDDKRICDKYAMLELYDVVFQNTDSEEIEENGIVVACAKAHPTGETLLEDQPCSCFYGRDEDIASDATSTSAKKAKKNTA